MSKFNDLFNLVDKYIFESKIDKDEINDLKKTIDMKIAKISKNGFKANTKEDQKLLDPKVQEKIKNLIYTCRMTDDYEEYTKARRELCMLTGLSSKKVIRPGSSSVKDAKHGYFYISTYDKKEQKNL